MNTNPKGIIYVENNIQKTLLECELFGQFSDGRWENSRNQSWKFWTDCNVEIGDAGYKKTSPGYYNIKPYDCNDTELLSYVGTRMLGGARFSHYFNKALTQDEYYFIEDIVGCTDTNWYQEITVADISKVITKYSGYAENGNNEYWTKKAIKFKAFVESYTAFEIVTALNNTYTKRDLRRDLRGINDSLRNQY